MRYRSLEDVIKLDQELFELATYEVTHGMIMVAEGIDILLDQRRQIANKFNYFKTLVRNNSCTLEFIKNTVLDKNGPFPQKQPKDIDEWIENMINPKEIEEPDPTDDALLVNNICQILKNIAGSDIDINQITDGDIQNNDSQSPSNDRS